MIFKAPEKNAILKSGYGINSIFFQYIHPWQYNQSLLKESLDTRQKFPRMLLAD